MAGLLTGTGSGEAAFLGMTFGGTGLAAFLTGDGFMRVFLGDGALLTIFLFVICSGSGGLIGAGGLIGVGGVTGVGMLIETLIVLAGMLSISSVEKTPTL